MPPFQASVVATEAKDRKKLVNQSLCTCLLVVGNCFSVCHSSLGLCSQPLAIDFPVASPSLDCISSCVCFFGVLVGWDTSSSKLL